MVSDKEFKALVIRMLSELWKKVDKYETFNKELENIKKDSKISNSVCTPMVNSC